MLYINFNPDPIIIEKIASLGSPEMLENYINDGKDTLPQKLQTVKEVIYL